MALQDYASMLNQFDPLEVDRKIAQTRGLKNANMAFQRESADADRKLKRENLLQQATRDALDPATGTLNPEKYRRSLIELGDYSGLQALEGNEAAKVKAGLGNDKLRRDAEKSQREAEKEQMLSAKSKIELIGQVAGAVKDEQSYASGLATLKNAGIDISELPPQYDPKYVEQARQQALSALQQVEQVWKQKDYDRDTEKFGETKRHNRVVEGNSAGQLGVARENIGLREKEIKQRGVELANDASNNPVLGVPQPAVYPWSNQTSAKDANKVKLAEVNRGAKEIEKDVDAARQAAQHAQDAKRFLELNGKVSTGGVTDKIGIGRAVQGLGSDYAEMESITARLAPANRVPGSGATSDYDAKQFERATVGVDKPKGTNTNISNAIIARSQLMQDYSDFRQTYLEQNGTLQGADRYWKQYVGKNPIFDPKKPGAFELNEARSDWRQHFATGQNGDRPKPPGNAKPSASPAATMRVTNAADYAKVPSGTEYIAPDGKTRRKP